MNQKINARAMAKLASLREDESLSLSVRTKTPLTPEEIDLLNAWGGTLLYDSGIMLIIRIPASRVNDLAEWETVLEII
jgi:hypothetical protein